MKVTLILLLVAAVAVVGVQSTSPVNCANVKCSDSVCTPVDCTCGSYKGSCGCCDVCYKCANAECIPLHQHRCQDGYECKLNDPAGQIFQGAAGTCVAQDHAHHEK